MSKKKSSAFTDADYVVQPQEKSQTEGYIDVIKEIGQELRDAGYKIENVPVPKRAGRKAVHTFPVAQLTPGSEQSFLVPSKPEDVKKTLTRIRTFAYRNDLKVTLRQEENGVRVWRAKI